MNTELNTPILAFGAAGDHANVLASIRGDERKAEASTDMDQKALPLFVNEFKNMGR